MRSVNNPGHLAAIVSALDPKNDEVIGVKVRDNFLDTRIVRVDTIISAIDGMSGLLQADVISDWIQENSDEDKNNKLVIIRGKYTDNYTKSFFFHYKPDDEVFLDLMVVDWDKMTWLSDMCTNLNCCNENDPTPIRSVDYYDYGV